MFDSLSVKLQDYIMKKVMLFKMLKFSRIDTLHKLQDQLQDSYRSVIFIYGYYSIPEAHHYVAAVCYEVFINGLSSSDKEFLCDN